MFKKISLAIVILAAAVLLYASTRPDHSRIERSLLIQAAPEAIFPYLNSPRAHQTWSPWENKDPDMQRDYSGPQAGKDAKYEWSGDSNIGKGRMTVIESNPPSQVLIALEFLEPMQANNTAEFTLRPEAGGTEVTWAMYGPANYLSKLMSLFLDFDAMIGKEFESGLAQLKQQVENGS